MKLTKLATTGVALLASAALVFGGATAANAAYPPATGFAVSGASSGAAGATKTYVVDAKKDGRYEDETVRTTLAGKSSTTAFNKSGTAKVTVKFPKLAGKYTITFKAFGKTATKAIVVGKAVSLSLKAANTKTSTTKFTGKTGAKATVKISVTTPAGKVLSTTVKANSKGVYTYTFKKATAKGTYTVKATYVQTSKYFGSSTKTVSFKRS